jgi:inositol 1,4,5-triphosphate receptor type 1/inositol 1,4,5-triphosphate receptor type 3
MVFAILGLFVHHFFFSFHLIELIITQPILKYVFLAFYEPLADFLFTLIFFFILIYFYSLLIFYRYYDLMPDLSCESPLICMMYIYSNTFTSGGNLGNFIDTKEESINLSGNMERYLLDISYTFIMVWLVWQMVCGLILDAFDSLRGDREEIEKDMETICYICGLNRDKIEKYYVGKEGFDKHLQDHSVENYLFYMLYLEDKDPNEYSGLESYVKENVDIESIDWFPVGRSLKIEEWENRHKS